MFFIEQGDRMQGGKVVKGNKVKKVRTKVGWADYSLVGHCKD